ncbi:hypothetical protein B0J11DRAFT_531655 [Dendryphion nanum]|uniref:Transmembrane protein n=1 Tax=Dendryphion nanum TaxID=256645 RepID=A0A9P9DP35_9PLEO|nr:hypothetical protein B0J11DRAFT_531655 [Dendryphion nanum]
MPGQSEGSNEATRPRLRLCVSPRSIHHRLARLLFEHSHSQDSIEDPRPGCCVPPSPRFWRAWTDRRRASKLPRCRRHGKPGSRDIDRVTRRPLSFALSLFFCFCLVFLCLSVCLICSGLFSLAWPHFLAQLEARNTPVAPLVLRPLSSLLSPLPSPFCHFPL